MVVRMQLEESHAGEEDSDAPVGEGSCRWVEPRGVHEGLGRGVSPSCARTIRGRKGLHFTRPLHTQNTAFLDVVKVDIPLIGPVQSLADTAR